MLHYGVREMTVMLKLRGPNGSRRVLLDCPHGTTYVDWHGPDDRPGATDRLLIALVIAKHEREETCGCARGADTLNRVGVH
jgi:hypothetical protein